MISITEVQKGYSGYKMEHVGSGVGKIIGGTVPGPAAVITIPLGHYIGKNVPKDPEKDIDESKRTHRVAAIADERLRAKRMLKHAAVGASIGAAVGATIGKKKGAVIGGGVGSVLGLISAGAVGGWRGAEKLGYGPIGKTSAALPFPGEYTGLLAPSGIKIDAVPEEKK